MVNNFVLVTSARTGSNYLMSLLAIHPHIKVLGEIFNMDSLAKEELQELTYDPLSYYEKKMERHAIDNIKYIGAKLFYDHLKPSYLKRHEGLDCKKLSNVVTEKIEKFDQFASSFGHGQELFDRFVPLLERIRGDENLRIIHLKRENILASLVSLHRAFLTNEWVSIRKARPRHNSSKLTLNYGYCRSYFEKIETESFETEQDYNNQLFLPLTYEELVADKEAALRRVTDFLDLESFKSRSVLQKQNHVGMADSLTNFDELKEKFSNTKWAWFFDE